MIYMCLQAGCRKTLSPPGLFRPNAPVAILHRILSPALNCATRLAPHHRLLHHTAACQAQSTSRCLAASAMRAGKCAEQIVSCPVSFLSKSLLTLPSAADLIDGKSIAKTIREELAEQVQQLKAQHNKVSHDCLC